MNRFATLLFLVALTSCQTTEDLQARVDADIDARLEAYNGSTIAQFTAQTGMLPADAYPVSGGRVFVFRMEPIFLTLPATHVTPTVTRSTKCQLLIRALRTNPAPVADSWKIMGTQWSDPCGNLSV